MQRNMRNSTLTRLLLDAFDNRTVPMAQLTEKALDESLRRHLNDIDALPLGAYDDTELDDAGMGPDPYGEDDGY